MLMLHLLPEGAVAGGFVQAEGRCSVVESPRPSQALVERGRTVGEAMRIAERNTGSRAAEDLDGLAGRHRTQNPVHQHSVLATI